VSGPRVGIVGARRVRQGLGPFVARDLVAAGASVSCFLVTSQRSIAPALAEIERHADVSPRGYTDAERMLDTEALDALAILSPAETHAEYLWRAARHGLAVLCEKPLVWGAPGLADRTAEIVEAFDARGILLYENCQWPCSLPAFERLHPGSLDAPPSRFAMDLQPASHGRQGLGDALSHPLSLLQALVPGDAPRVEEIDYAPAARPDGSVTLRFRYASGERSCDAEVRLRPDVALPRHAAFEIDGRPARRVVDPDGYRLSFAAADRSVPLDDPLTTLVADFVARLRTPDEVDRTSRARDIEQRMGLLEELIRAYVPEETP